MGSFTAASVFS